MLSIILNKNNKENESIQKSITAILGDNSCMYIDDEKAFLEYMKHNEVGIVIIDTDFINITGKLQKINKQLNIIYISNDDKYKKDAFDYRASGYIVRPVNIAKLRTEFVNLRYSVSAETHKKLRVQCFGNFDAFTIDGDMLRFKRSKSKELFAYLISRNGTSCNTRELVAVLFDDDSEKSNHYVQQVISSLGKTLKEYGCEEILHRTRNSLSINPAYMDCDYYRFLSDDETAKRLYTGDFMMQYEWADYVLAFLDQKSL